MASAKQALIGRFDITTDNQAHDVGGNALVTTAGKYYLAGYTGEGATSNLTATLQVDIRAIGATYSKSTVTFDAATGFVTTTFINSGDTPVVTTWTFTDTALGALLGYESSPLSGASTYTSTIPAKYVWRPNQPISDAPVDLTSVYAPFSATVVGATRGGKIVTAVQTTTFLAFLEWRNVSKANAILPSTGSINKEFVTYFQDVIAKGERMRYVIDRTTYAATSDYVTITAFPSEDPEPTSVGYVRDYMDRTIGNYQGLWDVSFWARKFL